MTDRDLIVGLDVGTTKVLTLVGVLHGERVRVLGWGHAPSTGVRNGVVVDLAETTGAIRESVLAAERSAGARVGSVVVSLSGEHLTSVNSRGSVPLTPAREVTDQDARRARRAAREVIHPPDHVILHNVPRQYLLDGQEGVRHPVGMTATHLEAETHVVTAGGSFLENLVKCVERAQLDVEDVVATPLASGLAVTTEAERTLGVLSLDIGGGATHVGLFREGTIAHTSTLRVGGGHFSSDLALGLRVSPEEAERLKRERGCAQIDGVDAAEFVAVEPIGEEPREVPRRLIAEILEPRGAEVAELVRQRLERATDAAALPASAVITGGGALLPGLMPVLADRLGIPTRVGLPRHADGPEGVLESPAASAAVGLLQFGAVRRGGEGAEPAWTAGLLRRLSHWLARRGR